MTDEQLDAAIAARQNRRLAATRHYEEAKLAKAEYQTEQARELLSKKLSQFSTQLAAADKALDKLDKRALEIRALRLQLE